jgi:peptidoglycan hydrolase-like protein with peptidoglycan-binding domain
MPIIAPGAVWRPVPNHGDALAGHQGLVLHVQAGDGSCFGIFSDPNYQASSHWWVGKNGLLEQYVSADQVAWTEMAGNQTWNAVETEGVPSEPLTPQQIQTLAHLYAWGHKTFGWPLAIADEVTGNGFGWHGMGGAAWGGHTGCPGELRKAQRPQILAIASRLVGPAIVPHPSAPPAASWVTISKGANGPEVMSVQRQLHLTTDGIFGPQTEMAVRMWQGHHNLTVDGVVGPITAASLGLIKGA